MEEKLTPVALRFLLKRCMNHEVTLQEVDRLRDYIAALEAERDELRTALSREQCDAATWHRRLEIATEALDAVAPCPPDSRNDLTGRLEQVGEALVVATRERDAVRIAHAMDKSIWEAQAEQWEADRQRLMLDANPVMSEALRVADQAWRKTTEKLAKAVEERDAALADNAAKDKAFAAYVEAWGVEHDAEPETNAPCPEDDTCDCPLILALNAAFGSNHPGAALLERMRALETALTAVHNEADSYESDPDLSATQALVRCKSLASEALAGEFSHPAGAVLLEECARLDTLLHGRPGESLSDAILRLMADHDKALAHARNEGLEMAARRFENSKAGAMREANRLREGSFAQRDREQAARIFGDTAESIRAMMEPEPI